MSTANFKVVSHVIEAGHIREYARATLDSQEDILHLAGKQYIPLNNLNPQPGDVTIIGAHANGFPKELYEPLWDEILALSSSQNFRIRAIWIFDAAHQSESSLLNQHKIGNDPSWLDNPRDMLHMINHFRREMPQPLVGIGHSYGGNNLVNISFMHPRLFAGHVLLDPVIQGSPSHNGAGPARMSTFRKDLWPSREEAMADFKRSPFYLSWDPRVLEAWGEYGIVETPTALYPDEHGSVTLATTKHQEVFTFLRPMFPDPANVPLDQITETSHADVDPVVPKDSNFYSPVPFLTSQRLHHLRPPVFYVFGENSEVNLEKYRKETMAITGTGVGGSGGAAKGKVKQVTLKNIGHLVAMETPIDTAKGAAGFIGETIKEWREEARKYDEWRKRGTKMDKQTTSEEWKRRIGGDPRGNRNGNKKKPNAKL